MPIELARVLLGMRPFTADRDLPQPPSSVKLHWNRVFDMYVEPPSQLVPILNCVQYTPSSMPPSQLVDLWRAAAPTPPSRTRLLRSRSPKRKIASLKLPTCLVGANALSRSLLSGQCVVCSGHSGAWVAPLHSWGVVRRYMAPWPVDSLLNKIL